MAKTMKAAVVHAFGKPLTIDEIPIPTPGPGEVLVKIVCTGVCGTDVHAATGDWPAKPILPLIPGHEGVGFVAALGSGVTELKEGDAVGIAWLHDACRECEYCETGWETLCEFQHNSGYTVNGSMAEYAIGAAPFVARLPKNVDFPEMAPILCAGVTTYKAIKQTEAKPGEWIAIAGIGGLGHVALQYSKAMGLHVAALDVVEEHLALARRLGAEVTVDAREPDAVAQVVKATGGGAHGVLVAATSVPAFAQALNYVRRKGTIALVGLPPGAFPTPIFDVVMKAITIRGSIVGTRRDLAEAVEFASEGKVKTHIHMAKLEDINTILDNLAHGKVDGRMVMTL